MITELLEEMLRRYHPWVLRNRKCADDWKPTPIDWLITAESPPCPRNEEEWQNPRYVYRIRNEDRRGNTLAGAITVGFQVAQATELKKLKHRSRLDGLKKNRVFIMDVCEYPIDQLDKDPLRIEIIKESMPGCFARRLTEKNPKNIIVLGKRDRGEFGYVVCEGLEEHLRSRVRNERKIPFPQNGGHNFENCWQGIRDCVRLS